MASDSIVIQRASRAADTPSDANLRRWALAALRDGKQGAVVIRLVDEAEGARLNRQFRGRSGATNVLSFSYAGLPVPEAPLGDLVVCAPVVQREAREQGKAQAAHWAHMVVHGMLHLCGYAHERGADAERMESLEIQVLQGLGFPDPYRVAEAVE